MTVYYMSFVNIDLPEGIDRFAGACLVHASNPQRAVEIAWERECNPGGEIAMIEPTCIPDEKWFYRILLRSELAELETELNEKYHKDNPKHTPGVYQ